MPRRNLAKHRRRKRMGKEYTIRYKRRKGGSGDGGEKTPAKL